MSSRVSLAAVAMAALCGCVKIDPGRGATLSLKANQASFAAVLVGESTSATITIQNDGGFDATSIAVSTPAAPFSIADNTCGTTLLEGAGCSVRLVFAPTAAGSSTATLTISFYDGEKTQSASFALQGNGLATPVAILELSGVDPFNLGTYSSGGVSATLTLTNTGIAAATTVAFSSVVYPFSLGSNACGATLAAGDSCTFIIGLLGEFPGPYSMLLEINYFDGVAPRKVRRTFQGTRTIGL